MAKVRYDGPGGHVLVYGHGRHNKGETRDYPDDFAVELVESNKRRHHFEILDNAKDEAPATEAVPKSQFAIVGKGKGKAKGKGKNG